MPVYRKEFINVLERQWQAEGKGGGRRLEKKGQAVPLYWFKPEMAIQSRSESDWNKARNLVHLVYRGSWIWAIICCFPGLLSEETEQIGLQPAFQHVTLALQVELIRSCAAPLNPAHILWIITNIVNTSEIMSKNKTTHTYYALGWHFCTQTLCISILAVLPKWMMLSILLHSQPQLSLWWNVESFIFYHLGLLWEIRKYLQH